MEHLEALTKGGTLLKYAVPIWNAEEVSAWLKSLPIFKHGTFHNRSEEKRQKEAAEAAERAEKKAKKAEQARKREAEKKTKTLGE